MHERPWEWQKAGADFVETKAGQDYLDEQLKQSLAHFGFTVVPSTEAPKVAVPPVSPG